MIYIASPYTSPDPAIRQARFEAVNRVAGRLMCEGHVVYSPISMTAPIAEACDLPKGWDYWARCDIEFLSMADSVIVLKLPGWEESVGVQAEIEIAHRLGLMITFMEAE